VNFDLIIGYLPRFLDGLVTTLWLVGLSVVAGLALSIPLALARISRVPVAAQAAQAYSYVMRGTPLLVQVYLLYFGLAQFEAVRNSPAWVLLEDPMTCLVLGFALNTAAYMSEIIRGAVRAVPKGEIEAARAFGMTAAGVARYVVLPNAFRRSIPPMFNEVIFLTHASAIASVCPSPISWALAAI
jgi:His/Glu/Gln/Arg/opine family amino acid ABC transporter permease subunit